MMKPEVQSDCNFILVDVVDSVSCDDKFPNHATLTEENLNCMCCAWCYLGHFFCRMAVGCCLACGDALKIC